MPNFATDQTSGGGGGGGFGNVGSSTLGLPSFSPSVAQYGLGGGSMVEYDDEARPYKTTGKLGLNLLNPGGGPAETQPGFFQGIFGALGGTFGEGGRSVGETIGKVAEAPFGLLGAGLGVVGGVPVPFGSELARGVGKVLQATGLTQEGQKAPALTADIVEGFAGQEQPDGTRAPVNLGGYFQSLLGTLGLLGRAVERKYAEGALLASGLGTGSAILGRREALPDDLMQAVKNGQMTTDEALDALVMRGAGFSDNPVANIAMSLGTDPLNIASLGVGMVGSAARGAAKVSKALELTGELAAGQRLSTGAAAARAASAGDEAGLMLSRLERAGLISVGRVPGFDQVLVPVANQVTRLTDPLKLFGGGNIGKRSTEALAYSASSGVIAAFKPQVVRSMQGVLGETQLNRLLGLRTTNLVEQLAIDDMAADAVKSGKVPFVTGEGGVGLNPTQVARATREGGAFDANIGKTIEVMVERQKPFLTHLSPADLAEQTRRKVGAMGGDASKLAKVGYDEAALTHALYYDHAASRLVDKVRPALKDDASLPTDIVPERLTMVGERTLTKQRVPELRAALDAADGPAVRAFITRYSDFDWINETAVAVEKNEDLFDVVRRYLDTNESMLLDEVPLKADGVLREDLPEALRGWAEEADEFGYGLALAPPADIAPEALYRITRDSEGRILNAKPWLDYTSEVTAVAAPGRVQGARMAMFRQIRAERILWTNRRRFVRSMSAEGISEREAADIYKRIMYTATEQGLTPRGLDTKQVYDAAKRALRDSRTAGIARTNLTEKSLINHLLVAFRGDLSQVGLTQSLTGTIKTTAPGAGANYWGRLTEHLYPLAKFTLAPWFITQELIEPYVLNLMRGVKTPLNKNSEGFKEALALRNAFNQVVRNSTEPDGAILEMAEYQRMLAISAQEVHRTVGRRGGFFTKMTDGLWGDVALRKMAGEALLTKKLFGQNLKKALTEIRGPQVWDELETTYRTTDAGDIAMQFLADQYHIASSTGERIGKISDMLNPSHVGRETRISRRGKGVTFDDLGDWLGRGKGAGDDLVDELKTGRLSRAAFITEVESTGIPKEFAERAFNMATGPEVDDFWNGYRKVYLKPVKGAKAKDQELAMHRALVQARASTMGLSEEEFIKGHFAAVPEGLTTEAALDGASALFEIRQDFQRQVLDRHGGSLQEARARVAKPPKPPKETFRSRVASALLDKQGHVNRTVVDELDDVSASTNLFNHLALANPDQLRGLMATMEPAQVTLAENALARAAASVPDRTMVFGEGKTIERYGNVTASDLLEQNLAWMDSAEGMAAGYWYPDMRQRFSDLFGEVDGPVLLAFAVSQASAAPTNGMQNVMRAMERMFVEGFEARTIGKFDDVGVPRRQIGVDPKTGGAIVKSSQLNEANIIKALTGAPITDRFAAKLNDFLDSLLGNQSRRWTGRSGGIQPAAIDRWTARDMGLLDVPAIDSIARRHGTRLPNGDIVIRDAKGVEHMTVRPVITEGAKSPKAFHLVDGEGNYVDRAGNKVDEPVSATDFDGAPNDIDYERGVILMNQLKDEFNSYVAPNGIQGVWGRTDWTAADVQAVGWIRMQKVMGGAEESPFDTFAANQYTIATEVSAEAGSDWAKYAPLFDTLDEAGIERVTSGMNTWLAHRLRDEFGVTSVVTDWVGPARWRGGDKTVSAPSVWLSSPETSDDIADVMALVFRQREVWNPKPVPISRFDPRVHHPVVDIVHPVTNDTSAAKAKLTALADAIDAPGATVLKDGEGRLVLRIIDRPFEGDAPFFVRAGPKDAEKTGAIRQADFEAQMEAAFAKAGVDPNTLEEVEVWNAEVYVAGPQLRRVAEAEAAIPVAQGATLDEIVQSMGVYTNESRQGVRPDLYMTHPKSGFTVRNEMPAPKVIAGPNGEPRLVDTVLNPNRMGERVVEGSERPLPYVFRAISEEDYQGILKRGYMQSDGRMNLLDTEGTVADKGDPSFYLPGRNQASAPRGDHPGRIIRIRIDEADGWKIDPRDEYIKTNARVPVDRIEMVSPKIVTRKGTKRSEITGNEIETVDTIVESPAAIQRAYDEGDVAAGQALNTEVAVGRGGTIESGGAVKATGAPATPLKWETALDDTLARLRGRGRAVEADTLSRLRDEATTELRDRLVAENRPGLRATDRGDVLHERRAGNVLGFTRRVDGDTRRVIGGLKKADPVTGLHELAHVFATDLDASMRDVVMRARKTAIASTRTDLDARIAEAERRYAEARAPGPGRTVVDPAEVERYNKELAAYEVAKREYDEAVAARSGGALDDIDEPVAPLKPVARTVATTAKSPRTAARYRKEAVALRHDLGEIADEEDWGVIHEEWFVDQFNRWIKTGDAPAEGLKPAFEHFRNWIEKVWSSIKGTTGEEVASPQMVDLFNTMFSKPRTVSQNFDMETHVNRVAARQSLMTAQDEAFTTHYFKMGRSFAERSINHPFTGLYPFSYMWGKVLPEMFRFLALRPFGMESPMLAWNSMREVSDTISAQKELDPAFAEWMEANEDTFRTISSLFPAVPSEVPMNAPLWMRRIAEQGMENADRAAAGEATKPIDYTKGLSDSAEYIFGPATAIRQGGDILASVGDTARRVLGQDETAAPAAPAGVSAPLIQQFGPPGG